MTRDLKSVPSATEGEYKWTVVIDGDPCSPGTFAAHQAMRTLLQACLSTHGMMACGANNPESLKMYHNGNNWVVVLEATGP